MFDRNFSFNFSYNFGWCAINTYDFIILTNERKQYKAVYLLYTYPRSDSQQETAVYRNRTFEKTKQKDIYKGFRDRCSSSM